MSDLEEKEKLLASDDEDTETTNEYVAEVSGTPTPLAVIDPIQFTTEVGQTITEGDFGTEDEPREQPLTEREIDLLRKVEKGTLGGGGEAGKRLQARAMAALSSTAVTQGGQRRPVEDVSPVDFGSLVRDTSSDDRMGEGGITNLLATASLQDPVAIGADGKLSSGGRPLEGYVLDKVIGKGVYGNVALGKDANERPVVVKKINLPAQDREAFLDQLVKETALQAHLKEACGEPSIVCDLKEFIVTSDAAYVVMEACDGSLENLFSGNARPSLDQGLEMLRDLAGMYQKMHDQGIAHSDLNGKNILFKKKTEEETSESEEETDPQTSENRLYIADFGLSGKIQPSNDIIKDLSPNKDAKHFSKMIMVEFLPAMTGLSQEEQSAIAELVDRFRGPDYAACRDYEVAQPNCLIRCFTGSNPPTRFSRLVNLAGELQTYQGTDPMGWCAIRLKAIMEDEDDD